jgi:hypothetical protein
MHVEVVRDHSAHWAEPFAAELRAELIVCLPTTLNGHAEDAKLVEGKVLECDPLAPSISRLMYSITGARGDDAEAQRAPTRFAR